MASRAEMMGIVAGAFSARRITEGDGLLLAELIALVCKLLDVRALEEWTAALQRDPHAPIPDSALTVARRT